MKGVVRKNAYFFAVWLAGSLQCVARCDFSNYAIMLEVLPSTGADNQSSGSGGDETKDTTAPTLLLSIEGSIIRIEVDIMSGTSNGRYPEQLP